LTFLCQYAAPSLLSAHMQSSESNLLLKTDQGKALLLGELSM
jgi:hypothetical protein